MGIDPSYLSQLIGPNPSRFISERTARRMEEKLGLASGLLDQETPSTAAASSDLIDRVMLGVDTALMASGVTLVREKYRGLVSFVYNNAAKNGGTMLDQTEIESLIALIK